MRKFDAIQTKIINYNLKKTKKYLFFGLKLKKLRVNLVKITENVSHV